MLNLPRLQRIRLSARPRGQRLIAHAILRPNFFLGGVKLELEHAERLPRHPVIYAMNHTDRFSYWPFQYMLYRRHHRFTATWVKGKNYEKESIARFMEMTNNIPVVSRGYLITRDFMTLLDRRPTEDEYAYLRSTVQSATNDGAVDVPRGFPGEVLEQPRDMFGRAFDPRSESYGVAMDAVFRAAMRRFVELNREAIDKGLDILVFPQGTRSTRLSKGHVGLSQIALRFRCTVVPVGANGTDALYPGWSPLAKRGRAIYRIGSPIPYDSLGDLRIDEPYEPFSAEADARYGARFEAHTRIVMDGINEVLDPQYQYGEEGVSDGVKGSHRFV